MRKSTNLKYQDFLNTPCIQNKADEDIEGIELEERSADIEKVNLVFHP